MSLAEVLGWIGAVLLLGAYGLVTAGALRARSALWQALNIFGALALTVSSTMDRRWPFVALNGAWFLIGLVALARSHRERI